MNSSETFNSLFAKNLRHYLEINQMSQVELSKKLNVGTTSVYNWCNGVKTPRMDKVDKMCQIFGCKRSDLITDSVPAGNDPNTDLALELYKKYMEAAPNIRAAVQSLLGDLPQDP